ncbi:MAG: phosphatidate cytidylyltransferase, partial [Malacoplasma sp.]|nr:phosphatidate cytidylyltransferase [Malacoplasma sp.]
MKTARIQLKTIKHQHKLINDIDNNKKKNFKNRTVISVFVVIYYLLILGLTILADQTKSEWTSFDTKISGIFAILLVVVIYIPFIFAVLEATRLVFRSYEKIPIIILMIVATIAYIIPALTLIFTNYFINHFYVQSDEPVINSQETANFFLYSKLTYTTIISSLVSWMILIIVLNIVLKAFYKANFKNVITLNALLMIIVFGFDGFIFVSIFKGWTALLFLLISVLVTDALCYIWGLLFGKHKMAKIISPNKTWEGAILGSVSSVALLMIYCGLLTIDNHVVSSSENRWLVNLQNIASFSTVYDYSLWILILFIAIILVIFAILGDLLFSYVKRSFAIKDFSNYLKSHGGFLDRVDSLLVASLIFFIYSLIAISVYSFVNFPTNIPM